MKNVPKICFVISALLSIGQLAKADKDSKEDPVVLQAGSINVRRSQLVAVESLQEIKSTKTYKIDSASLYGDSAYDQVMQKAEMIAQEFSNSKVTGIYRIKLSVSGNEYEIWKQYQRDLAQVFEKHLQQKMDTGADKLEVIVNKLFGGNGESDQDVVVETDQRLGKVQNFNIARSIRLRGGSHGTRVVVDFVDRNFTPQSRTTLSILAGKSEAELRARHNIDLGVHYFGHLPGFSILKCDVRRFRNSDETLNRLHWQPIPRYESQVGCELEWHMK